LEGGTRGHARSGLPEGDPTKEARKGDKKENARRRALCRAEKKKFCVELRGEPGGRRFVDGPSPNYHRRY